MTEWKRVKIGDFLTESKIVEENSSPDRKISVRLNLKGVEKRPLKAEKENATKYYKRSAGQFIYGKQNIHKGAFGVIPDELDGFASSSDLPAFDVSEATSAEWICLCLKRNNFYETLAKAVTGVGSQRLSVEKFLNIEIPFLDKPQQEKIILEVKSTEKEIALLQDEIAEQKVLIKKLRQSILQDAIEGRLTENWRKENPLKKGDINFDAEALFEKIQDEKSKQEKGNKKKKDNGKLQVIDYEEPFEIPKTWKWVRLGEIGLFTRGNGIKRNEVIENGFPCIRYGELYTTYKTRFSETKSFISKVLYDKSHKICYGDICMALTGENKVDIALAVAYEGQTPVAIGGDMTCFKSLKNNFLFLVFLLNSPYGIKCKKNLATGDFICHISNDKLASILIPLPPLAEQNEIVRRIEKQLDKVEQLEKQVEERENLTKSLFRGILKNAFEGR